MQFIIEGLQVSGILNFRIIEDAEDAMDESSPSTPLPEVFGHKSDGLPEALGDKSVGLLGLLGDTSDVLLDDSSGWLFSSTKVIGVVDRISLSIHLHKDTHINITYPTSYCTV